MEGANFEVVLMSDRRVDFWTEEMPQAEAFHVPHHKLIFQFTNTLVYYTLVSTFYRVISCYFLILGFLEYQD